MYGLAPYTSAPYCATLRAPALVSKSNSDAVTVTDAISFKTNRGRTVNSAVAVTDTISFETTRAGAVNSAVGVTNLVSFKIVRVRTVNVAIGVTDLIAFTIVRGPTYVSNASGFPGANWDGSSTTRKNPNVNGETALNVYREPDANDWQRVQNEVIAVEVQLQTNTTTLTTTAKIAGANNSAALATSATTGFGYLPTCAGTPTGVPAATPSGYLPCVYDTTAHKLWIYDTTWKYVTMT